MKVEFEVVEQEKEFLSFSGLRKDFDEIYEKVEFRRDHFLFGNPAPPLLVSFWKGEDKSTQVLVTEIALCDSLLTETLRTRRTTPELRRDLASVGLEKIAEKIASLGTNTISSGLFMKLRGDLDKISERKGKYFFQVKVDPSYKIPKFPLVSFQETEQEEKDNTKTTLHLPVSIVFPKLTTKELIFLSPRSIKKLSLDLGGTVQVHNKHSKHSKHSKEKFVTVEVKPHDVPFSIHKIEEEEKYLRQDTVCISQFVADFLCLKIDKAGQTFPVVQVVREAITPEDKKEQELLIECKKRIFPRQVLEQVRKEKAVIGGNLRHPSKSKRRKKVLVRIAKIVCRDTYEIGLSTALAANVKCKDGGPLQIAKIRGEEKIHPETDKRIFSFPTRNSLPGFALEVTSRLAKDLGLETGDFGFIWKED